MAFSRRNPLDLLDISLAEEERYVLTSALLEWGGSAPRPTLELVNVMGFETVSIFDTERKRLRDDIEQGKPMTRFDWQRASVATEICFASDVFGSGLDWSIVGRLSDEETIRVLRSFRRKILAAEPPPRPTR
jgi:hypothetical protein